ncbi:MAG: hypothetical protein ABIF80_04485, partial [Patescibacteria group bacterium]
MKNNLILLAVFAIAFLIGAFASPANAANLPMQGYAWSDNIGWIQFDSTKNINNDVRLDDQTGDLNGYAWSDNIGWVWFDAPDDGTHPSAKVDSYTSCSGTCAVSGWAKAIAADNNGWDGWIKFGPGWTNSAILDKSGSPYIFNGFAWGSDVVGWISLSGTGYGVIITSDSDFSISVEPTSQSINQTDSVGKEYIITITSLNGFSSAVDLTKICPSGVGISCSISLTTVTPPANGSVDSKITVITSN